MSRQTYEFTVRVTSDPKVSNSYAAALTNGTPDPEAEALAELEECFLRFGGTVATARRTK